MKKLLTICLLFAVAMTASAQVQRPKLVVGLAVDQMRWDYLYYYYDQFGEGGLKRLVKEGFDCQNTQINYVPSVTAIGHHSIYTGSVPAVTGIAGNNFRDGDRWVYCCDDASVKAVGSENPAGQMSPHYMYGTTIGDMLRVATDYRSKVVGVSIKDRAAILPAGHAANAAYWYDKKAGHFISSTYYMNALPQWVNDFNKTHTEPGLNLIMTPKGVTWTFDMAKAAIDGEQLGQRGQTDMICVSISPTDAIGHAYSTRGAENKAVYMQLDKDLTSFLNYLDAKVGKGNYLLFLTADHGAIHNPNQLNEHNIRVEGWDGGKTISDLNAYLKTKFGVDKLVERTYATFIFLNHKTVREAGLKLEDVKAEAVKFLREDPQFLFAFDPEKVSSETLPQVLREKVTNGYYRGRSGDLYVVLRANYYESKFGKDFRGTTHGQWNPYDAHIPLIFFGWHVNHGETSALTRIVDIAPTVCAMLHIQMPDACIGTAITQVADPAINR